jgi:hypothetical protein
MLVDHVMIRQKLIFGQSYIAPDELSIRLSRSVGVGRRLTNAGRPHMYRYPRTMPRTRVCAAKAVSGSLRT